MLKMALNKCWTIFWNISWKLFWNMFGNIVNPHSDPQGSNRTFYPTIRAQVPPNILFSPSGKLLHTSWFFYFPLPENLKNSQKDQTKSKSQKTVRALSNVYKGCVREGIDIPGNHEHSLSPSTTLPPYSPPPFPHPPSPPRERGGVGLGVVVGCGVGVGSRGGGGMGGGGEGGGMGEKYDLWEIVRNRFLLLIVRNWDKLWLWFL